MLSEEEAGDLAAARALIEAVTEAGPVNEAEQVRFADRWPAIVQLCSRSPEARTALRDLRDPLARVAEELEGAHWVRLIIGVLHEEPFVTIEPATGRGLIGRLSGIADNFQLHTLLMDALPERTGRPRRMRRRVSESAAATARGDGPQESDEIIAGAWDLFTYAAWRDDRLPEGDLQATATWIWNEGTPADIPQLDCHRVVLLGEPAYVRTWPSTRLFPDLPATLGARDMTGTEIDAWLERISEAAAGGGPTSDPGSAPG